MSTEVRIGIVGVGMIGRHHLQKYVGLSDAKVVAVSDVNEKALAEVAEKYQVPHTYTDFRELLQRDDLDAIDVCVHNNLHAPVALAAFEAGKHVYSEKPIAGSYADGLQMVEAAKAYGKMLHVQLWDLYRPETRLAKHLIDQGKLGNIYHARSTGHRRRGRPYVDGYGTPSFVRKEMASGGAIYDMGVYHIATMLYLLGIPEVKRISGKLYQEMDMDLARRQASGYDVEELGMGFVRLDRGIVLDVIEAWAIHLNAFEGSYIVGSEGGIRINPFSYHTTIDDVDFDMTANMSEQFTRWHQMRETETCYDSSEEHWLGALQGRVDLLPTAQLALQTMLISEGIYLSDQRGCEIDVEEVKACSQSKAIRL